MLENDQSLTLGLACYNVESTVAITLTSIMNQKLDYIHAIAIDDCSSDATVEILESFQKKFERRGYKLTILQNEVNVGVGKTRNRIIDSASTEYLGFIDPDDYVDSHYFYDCVKMIGDSDMLRTDHIRFDGCNRSYIKAPFDKPNTPLDPKDYILPVDDSSGVDYANTWSGIYRLSKLNEKKVRCATTRTAEDRLLIWGCHLHFDTMIYSPISGYFYRRGSTNTLSLTSGSSVSTFDVFDVLEEVEKRIVDQQHLKKLYRQSLAMMEFHFNRKDSYGSINFEKLLDRMKLFFSSREESTLAEALEQCSDRRKYIFKKVS